ncbi:carboxypeptidase-like regulatory domain-containing protein [Luteimonas sp. XNQY3]|nr:carboxypeptidase-like regulatory domain-containing protein [Luteimonas sp. XNQY3]MCD9005707.1 carboxypeptidase-like regulatory domain-containing protein [Luteimonas sp. XNQY3]
MTRSILKCCGIGLCVLLILYAHAVQAQVRSASRHVADDRARAAQAQQQHLNQLFDRGELESMLELGNGGLRGVMGHSEKAGRSLAGLLSRPTTAVADREWVFLLPMTRYVQAWHQSVGGRILTRDLRTLHPDAWKYAGRVRTDTQGNFEFAGLKPGRYLVFAEFPVGFDVVENVDTGRRTISYSPAFGAGSIDPVYQKVYSRDSVVIVADQVVDVREGQTTRYRPAVERVP